MAMRWQRQTGVWKVTCGRRSGIPSDSVQLNGSRQPGVELVQRRVDLYRGANSRAVVVTFKEAG
jgi:hypothetical protein